MAPFDIVEVASLASNLYSNSSYVVLDGNDHDDPSNELSIELEQQKAVLSRDDIVDSSDSEGEGNDNGRKKMFTESTNNQRPLLNQSKASTTTKKIDRVKKRQPDIIVID